MISPDDTRAGADEPEETGARKPGAHGREIVAILLGAVSVLGLVSLTGEAVGSIGAHLAAMLRGLAGRGAWLPPVFLMAVGALAVRRTWRPVWVRRACGLALVFGIALVVIHLIDLWPDLLPATQWRGHIRLGLQGLGGGMLGGAAAGFLVAAFGLAGTVVLLAAALLVAAILLFDVSVAELAGAVARGLWRALSGAARKAWQVARIGAAEAVTDARRAWERRQLRAQREGSARWRDVPSGVGLPAEGESFARPFTRRNRDPRASGSGVTGFSSDQTSQGDQAAGFRDDPAEPERREGEGAGRRALASAALALRDGRDPMEGVTRPSGGDGPATGGEEALAEAAAAAEEPAAGSTGNEGPLLQLRDWGKASRYRMPPLSLLELPRPSQRVAAPEPDRSQKLEETLASFGVEAKVVNVSRGPVITRYELQPGPGVKVSKITSLVDDLALALATGGLRIEAPVPGKAVVGIEVPNRQVSTVYLREVIESAPFSQSPSPLTMALGKDIAGQPVVADLKKILHLLIAGATGSGKSVCLNAIIVSMLYKARPTEVKFIMVDPKRVELAVYDGIPHLITPVVTDPRQAAGALRWAVKEMERRYQLISQAGARNIDGYNAIVARRGDPEAEVLPYLVVIIDELADLMLVAAADVEDAICRLAQMARAAGIFLVIATQRPSVDVITGLIKANVPSRIAFAVSSQVDSRTILDMAGAERLLGKGDMLFHPLGSGKPQRVQGAFIGDREVEDVVNFWKEQESPAYVADVLNVQDTAVGADDEVEDELFEEAVRLVREQGHASVSMIQRRFRVGYARAARLIDMMEKRGIVGPYQGSKPREVLGAYRNSPED